MHQNGHVGRITGMTIMSQAQILEMLRKLELDQYRGRK